MPSKNSGKRRSAPSSSSSKPPAQKRIKTKGGDVEPPTAILDKPISIETPKSSDIAFNSGSSAISGASAGAAIGAMVGGPLGAAIGAGVGALFSAYLGTPAGKDFLHNLKQGTFGETNKGEDTNQGDILK